MTATTIDQVHAWEALDSRGRPTVGCTVVLEDGGEGRAIVPAGASTGGHEAVELRDGGERYDGWGVRQAVQSVRGRLGAAVLGADAADQSEIDARLTRTDPDPLLAHVGANAVLAVSLAAMRAAAAARQTPLWEADPAADEVLLPLPMVNIVSGGAHAGGAIDIQDVLVVPVGASSFAEAIEWADRVRRSCRDLLAEHGGNPAMVADEGGLAARFPANEAALGFVVDGITGSGLEPGREVALALDLAANQFYEAPGYRLRREDRTLTPGELIALVADWCAQYPIVSVEDVLAEDSWDDWRTATDILGPDRQLLGDDLFATDLDRLHRGVSAGVANAVLVKPNQAGTVTRALRVVQAAQRAGYPTVLSARSGDTEDHWLADLAVRWRTGQIKVGSTHRSERTAKWNRLLEIEARAGARARFAGAAALPGPGKGI
ncbi:MAG: phosphopyruvate hydratase [Jatrophihabitans sp.]